MKNSLFIESIFLYLLLSNIDMPPCSTRRLASLLDLESFVISNSLIIEILLDEKSFLDILALGILLEQVHLVKIALVPF